ncbi:hypothetical protein C0J52_03968 [Blattella germanica]|nr:hypothetical protein C0J52_03968 [Blattella germanica]
MRSSWRCPGLAPTKELWLLRCKLSCGELFRYIKLPVNVRLLSTINQGLCWKCGSGPVSGLFCNQCNTLQKPEQKTNYFSLMGIKEEYKIDDRQLTTKFRKLQNILHPDRFSTKTEEECSISEEYSSLVNKAYSTLLQPLERGLYMLQQKGVTIEEDGTQMDPTFLAVIMETNEQLADAQSMSDVERLDNENKKMLLDLTNELEAAFNADDITTAKSVLIKMKYYNSIDGRIKELKQKFTG